MPDYRAALATLSSYVENVLTVPHRSAKKKKALNQHGGFRLRVFRIPRCRKNLCPTFSAGLWQLDRQFDSFAVRDPGLNTLRLNGSAPRRTPTH